MSKTNRSGNHWKRTNFKNGNKLIRVDQSEWVFEYNDVKKTNLWTGSRGKKLVIAKKGTFTVVLDGNQIKTLKKLLAGID